MTHKQTITFKDDIHGQVLMEKKYLPYIDNRIFQRTRNLKQLGFTHYVFHGATHTRFEHSIGVFHITNKMCDFLKIKEENKELINLGALCHDLGHGAYSHVYESYIRKYHNPMYDHEQMSLFLFDKMIDENHIDLDKPKINFVHDVITGNPSKPQQTEFEQTQYLYQIVANNKTNIDTDKFDYITRDSHKIGVFHQCDYERIIYNSAIDSTGNISYYANCQNDIYNLFDSRYKLFKCVYGHNVTKALELMFFDVLKKYNVEFKISSNNHDLDFFINSMNDSILDIIKYKYPKDELIKKICKRDLYKVVFSTEVDKKCLTIAKEFENCVWSDKIRVDTMKIEHSKNKETPLSNVTFLNKSNSLCNVYENDKKNYKKYLFRVYVTDEKYRKEVLSYIQTQLKYLNNKYALGWHTFD